MRYIDHPDHYLDPRAFAGDGRVYGKSSPPPPPDYSAAARETASGNLEAARAATRANRVNQFTPWGNLTWSQAGQNQIDWNAYNAAQQRWQQQQQRSQSSNPFVRMSPAFANAMTGGRIGGGGSSGAQMGAAPRPEDFMVRDPDGGWSQTVSLTPEAQAALDAQMRMSRAFGETAEQGFERVRGLFENPALDVSQLPARAIDVGQTAQQAIMSRLSPQLAQQEEALRTRLANQGITLGSQAYQTEMQQQAQRANDLQLQAALQGINLDQSNRGAALQEQAFLQDRPLNLINALRTGAQVQAPQFQQFAQQATTAGPNMLGAAQAQYGAQMDAFNADQAQGNALMSGLFGVGMGMAGLPVAGGGSLGGNFIRGLF